MTPLPAWALERARKLATDGWSGDALAIGVEECAAALRDARAMGPEWQRDGAIPNHEGFWWGKWRIKAEGTSDPEDTPGNEWEVMHVVENTLDVDDDEHLMVMVPGVEKWQPLENFVWGPKALPAAPKES